jgi:hypothetical protein
MRSLITAIAVTAAISLMPTPSQANFLGLFGFDCGGAHNCGCGLHAGCGSCCEPACGCDSCCEPACGCESCCEPACGCGTGCYANGRQYAGQCFSGCCQSRAPICPCVNRDGCCQGGCGSCCEPACGCDSCCESTCGCGGCCEPCGGGSGCGKWGTACCPHKCCMKNCGFCSCCGHLVNALCCCTPCSGCSGEIYWSEWHNDPPYCQDPCNCCGEWSGPNAGGCGCNGGCNGGCSNGACGCDGGYSGAQSTPMNQNGSQVAQRRPANRTIAGNYSRGQQSAPAAQVRSSYANQQQVQTGQMRAAARPAMNRAAAPSSRSGTNGNTQAKPILW